MERRAFSTASAAANVSGPNGAYASIMEVSPTSVTRANSRGLHRHICSMRLSHAMHRPTALPRVGLWLPCSLRRSPTWA